MKKWTPKQIRAFRKSLNLTQYAFSNLVGVTRRYVIHLEQGTKTPSETLKILFTHMETLKKKGG